MIEKSSFTDKQNLNKFITTTSFTRNAKGNSLSKKEKATTRNMKIMKGKNSLVKANIQWRYSINHVQN